MDIFKEAEEQDLQDLRDQIEYAQKAKELYDNPFVKGWIDNNKAVMFEVLETIPLNDAIGRQRAVDLLGIFIKFEKNLIASVSFGEDALKKWKEILEIKKSVKEMIF